MKQQLYQSIQHKQAKGSTESQRPEPCFFPNKRPSLRACRGHGLHHPNQREHLLWERPKTKRVGEKVNNETLWSRFPSCAASSVNINRIYRLSALRFSQINSVWVRLVALPLWELAYLGDAHVLLEVLEDVDYTLKEIGHLPILPLPSHSSAMVQWDKLLAQWANGLIMGEGILNKHTQESPHRQPACAGDWGWL